MDAILLIGRFTAYLFACIFIALHFFIGNIADLCRWAHDGLMRLHDWAENHGNSRNR